MLGDARNAAVRMLTMTNLSKVYRTEFLETFALRDFSIDVKKESSSQSQALPGKTTFLNIAGILEEFTNALVGYLIATDRVGGYGNITP